MDKNEAAAFPEDEIINEIYSKNEASQSRNNREDLEEEAAFMVVTDDLLIVFKTIRNGIHHKKIYRIKCLCH